MMNEAKNNKMATSKVNFSVVEQEQIFLAED